MRWPWVSRYRLEFLRLQSDGNERRAIVAEERAASLSVALEKCDTERRETWLRLLRMAQGLPIFPDGVTPVQEATPEESVRVLNFTGMTEDEINRELTRVAVGMGMRDLGKVTHFIERQKSIYYRDKDRQKLSDEETELRESALRSIDESIQQGKADAQRSN